MLYHITLIDKIIIIQSYVIIFAALQQKYKAMSVLQPKYYRIITHSPVAGSKDKNQNNSPQKLTQSIVKNKHYVYIDINSQNGLCQMQKIEPKQADQQIQKISRNAYICSVNNLPMQSQKTLDYVYKLQQLKKQKQKFKKLLKEQLNVMLVKKREKLNKKSSRNKKQRKGASLNLKNQSSILTIDQSSQRKSATKKNKLAYSTINDQSVRSIGQRSSSLSPQKIKNQVIIYKGMETKLLKQYLQKKQLQQINERIVEKEKLLIAKYGFTNEYQSLIKEKSHIVRKHRKIILPQIKYSSVPF